MSKLGNSLRTQLIFLTIVSLLLLAGTLEFIHLLGQRDVLINSERRVGLTLIRSVNNTIDSVRSFITTLSDISELDSRLDELVQLNANIDFIAVTDDDGNIIVHSNENYVGTRVDELAQLSVDTTIPRTVPGFGEIYLTSLVFDSGELRGPSQYWIVVASGADLLRSQLLNTALSSILVTVIFTLIAAIVIIFFVQTYFVHPLEQLTQAANMIEAGDLAIQVATKQNNEIGQLARSFNQMTQRLAISINTLEERVRERTHDLEIARDQAEQASRAKSDFLSNMSHELRTPLNMVIGYTSSMLNMPLMYNNVTLPEVFRKDIELIRDSGKHLLTLINDILDLSKVEAGKLKLSFSAVDLNSTFDGVIAASLGLVGDKPLQLRQNYPDNLPQVWADPVRVRQILLNLLSNGIKYTETGSVTLSAEVVGETVHIAVTDTGPGIPESAIQNIFDRFEQFNQNRGEVQGTGLGLDISQRLAQLHGAQITIDSKVGMGSTFAFTLPIATEEQLGEKSEPQSSAANSELFTRNATLQITTLIIASEISTRQALRRIVEEQGMLVVEASESQHAVRLAMGVLPELIILDSEMDTVNHQQLLAELQNDADTQAIPIILLENGRNAPDIQSDLIKTRVQKPINPTEIIQTLQSISNNQPSKEI